MIFEAHFQFCRSAANILRPIIFEADFQCLRSAANYGGQSNFEAHFQSRRSAANYGGQENDTPAANIRSQSYLRPIFFHPRPRPHFEIAAQFRSV